METPFLTALDFELSRPVDVSHSELKSWNQCPAKWWFKYVLRLRPKAGSSASTLGTLVHEVLAQYYDPTLEPEFRTQNLLLDLFEDAWKEALGNGTVDSTSLLHSRAVEMLENYFLAWSSKDWELAFTEMDFRVPIFSHTLLSGFVHGRFDGVWIDINGGVWIVDHKTTKRFATESLLLNTQIDLYSVAGSKLFGDQFKGVIINYIRSEPSKSSPNFQHVKVRRIPPEIQFLETNLASQLVAMGSVQFPQINFHFGDDCGWRCEYPMLCKTLRGGGNLRNAIMSFFKLRPPSDSELEGD